MQLQNSQEEGMRVAEGLDIRGQGHGRDGTTLNCHCVGGPDISQPNG